MRSVEIVVERPDGQRNTVPYPLPLRYADGNLVGAVNVLIDAQKGKQ
jgi:hypothetical protein